MEPQHLWYPMARELSMAHTHFFSGLRAGIRRITAKVASFKLKPSGQNPEGLALT